MCQFFSQCVIDCKLYFMYFDFILVISQIVLNLNYRQLNIDPCFQIVMYLECKIVIILSITLHLCLTETVLLSTHNIIINNVVFE